MAWMVQVGVTTAQKPMTGAIGTCRCSVHSHPFRALLDDLRWPICTAGNNQLDADAKLPFANQHGTGTWVHACFHNVTAMVCYNSPSNRHFSRFCLIDALTFLHGMTGSLIVGSLAFVCNNSCYLRLMSVQYADVLAALSLPDCRWALVCLASPIPWFTSPGVLECSCKSCPSPQLCTHCIRCAPSTK